MANNVLSMIFLTRFNPKGLWMDWNFSSRKHETICFYKIMMSVSAKGVALLGANYFFARSLDRLILELFYINLYLPISLYAIKLWYITPIMIYCLLYKLNKQITNLFKIFIIFKIINTRFKRFNAINTYVINV